MTFVTRFAPSPTGPLHLGHAYSALLAYDKACAAAGQFHLRIEDIDQTRSRPHWEDQIYEDLRWLGLEWIPQILRQSDRSATYSAALTDLWRRGLLYPCSCTRRDILAANTAPQEGVPSHGPDGVIYPGTCRPADAHGVLVSQDMPTQLPLRLNMARALASLPNAQDLSFDETGDGANTTRTIRLSPKALRQSVGDIVLSRKDFLGSYHLSVVLDDAAQNVTHVIRGRDLFDATQIHVLLQHLLDLPTPVYHHHRLIRDGAGKRLAKRDDARAIAKYRADGATPQDIRTLVGL